MASAFPLPSPSCDLSHFSELWGMSARCEGRDQRGQPPFGAWGDVGECVWARAPARMLASSAFSQVVHSAREAQRNEMHSLEDWAAPVISFPSLRCVLWAHLVLFARGLAPLGCLPAPLLPLVCLVKGLRHVGEGGEGQRWKGFVPSGAVTL